MAKETHFTAKETYFIAKWTCGILAKETRG
jgi:hypothetical protein